MDSNTPVPVSDIVCPICGGEVGYQCGTDPTSLEETAAAENTARHLAWTRVPWSIVGPLLTAPQSGGLFDHTAHRPPAPYYPASEPWPPEIPPPMGGYATCRKGVDPNRGRWRFDYSCLWRGTPLYRGEDGGVYLSGPLLERPYTKGEIADFLFPSDIQKLSAAFDGLAGALEDEDGED